MEGKMTRRSKPKRRQKRKLSPNSFQRQLSENDSAVLDRIATGGSVMPRQPNANDNLAIQRLYRVPVGDLLVDRFAPDAPKPVPTFRLALINVYINAAQARLSSKATKRQLKTAATAQSLLERAVTSVERAVTKLDQITPPGQGGLQLAIAGSPVDDITGELELNKFASACREIRMTIAPYALALREAIRTERVKQTRSGERQKRLRTLVEALADWWLSIGRSLAPTVDANRRDKAPAVVHRRYGDFLQLAVELFCYVDVFAHTEVEAAVTNVYEGRLKAAQSSSGD
jgi:hypothetical protein